tara:strand:+ start:16239 stop:16856 length:618 start_codon:yes stop_codon:yes gene_type:complete
MANFELYAPIVRYWEGGYQNNPKDGGNFNSLGQLVGTNHGISARWYESVIGRPPTKADMMAITKAKAKELFRVYFWDAQGGNDINSQAIANTIIDHEINAGNGVKLAQECYNDWFKKPFEERLKEDDDFGDKTSAAINSVDPNRFVPLYNGYRERHYRTRSNSAEFIDGWLKRLKAFAIQNSTTISMFTVVAVATAGIILYRLTQ